MGSSIEVTGTTSLTHRLDTPGVGIKARRVTELRVTETMCVCVAETESYPHIHAVFPDLYPNAHNYICALLHR